MTTYQSELMVDFGQVGFQNATHGFRLSLNLAPLMDMIQAAEDAHRVHEFLLIDRPGDIWAYTLVVLHELPPILADRVAWAMPLHTSP